MNRSRPRSGRSAVEGEPASSAPDRADLRRSLDALGFGDRRRFARRIDRCRGADDRRKLADAISTAVAAVERRRERLPTPTYPAELPITARRDELLEVLTDNQVVIVAGETGSGKSTQLPKLLLEAGCGVRGMIGHTQPRRVAARTIAQRVAEELGTEPGDLVGHSVRFDDRVGEDTLVKVMTDGILLAELHRDRLLGAYDALIVDEAHERSLNIDFLLGYLKRLLPDRPDLKVVITSATIDTERFSAHFDDAPVVTVSGRTHPVEIRYRPFGAEADLDIGSGVDTEADGDDRDQNDAIGDAVAELMREGPGDVLVFLPGERDIHEAADVLGDRFGSELETLPLYARLSAAEQQRVFRPHRRRRVVLATNVAETSLTVPGIRYVVDVGTARISRFSNRSKVQRLPIERVSRASADQRAGRCGRLGPGVCIRLYTEDDLLSRDEFTDPEIRRTNLASVILRMLDLGLGDVEAFPFLDPPDTRSIRDGTALLEELGALRTRRGEPPLVTDVGRRLVRLPIDPRLGRMLLEADRLGAVREVAIITAALSIRDPRERPAEHRGAADELHRRFRVPGSDLLSFVTLWDHLQERRDVLSNNAFRRECRDEYLNHLRIREWWDLVRQVRRAAREIGIEWSDGNGNGNGGAARRAGHGRRNGSGERGDRRDRDGRGAHGRAGGGDGRRGDGPEGRGVRDGSGAAHPDSVHRSLLAGLLSHVGMKDRDEREYRGARNVRFQLARDSALARKPPAWVMVAELTETNRLWGRGAAAVEPSWIEGLAGHLVKRSHGEPRWSERDGRAETDERVTLYGLPIVTGREVGYDRVDRDVARDLFLEHALVRREWESRHDFLRDNEVFLTETRELTDKLRTTELLDDDALFRFYDRRIPDNIVSGRHFDRWWKDERGRNPDLLTLTRADLVDDGLDLDPDAFPDTWVQGDLELPLTYLYEPGHDLDGVTVHIPMAVLDRVEPWDFDWQVPGRRHELIEALLLTLPKRVRRDLNPIAENARRAAEAIRFEDRPLVDVLAAATRELTDARVRADQFDPTRLPPDLRITFAITDGDEVVALGKDLEAVRDLVGTRVRAAVADAVHDVERSGLTRWDIGDLPVELRSRSADGFEVVGYPALLDEGDTVAVKVLSRVELASRVHRSGLRRLVLLNTVVGVRKLAKHVPTSVALALTGIDGLTVGTLLRDAIDASADRVIDQHVRRHGDVRDEAAFDALLERAATEMPRTAEQLLATAGEAVVEASAVAATLDRLGLSSFDGVDGAHLEASLADARRHLDRLVRPGFVRAAGRDHLSDLPRYLRALAHRLAKLPESPRRDQLALQPVLEIERLYGRLLDALTVNQMTPRVREVGWRLEELRVSVFAQSVGARGGVSAKKLRREIDRLFAGELD